MNGELKTLSQLAAEWGQKTHRLEYVVRSRKIRPTTRFGNCHVYDRRAAESIRRHLGRTPAPLAQTA